jgi:uncharacterized protein (DUF1697 family)
MVEYVAFLRGINSGKNPTLKMDQLKNTFENLGFQNVTTVLASGNVIFMAEEQNINSLEEKIEEEILKEFKFVSPAIVKTSIEIENLIATKPFGKSKLSKTKKAYVSFLKEDPDDETVIEGEGFEILDIKNCVVFSIVDLDNAKTPDLMKVLDKKFGKEVTTRGWATIEKIFDKLSKF